MVCLEVGVVVLGRDWDVADPGEMVVVVSDWGSGGADLGGMVPVVLSLDSGDPVWMVPTVSDLDLGDPVWMIPTVSDLDSDVDRLGGVVPVVSDRVPAVLNRNSGDLALAAVVVNLAALSLVRVVSFPVNSVLVRTVSDPDGLTLTPAALAPDNFAPVPVKAFPIDFDPIPAGAFPVGQNQLPLSLDLIPPVLHPYAQYQTGISPVFPYPAAVNFPHLLLGPLLQS